MLAVLPFAGADVFLACQWWLNRWPGAAMWTIGLSALLGLATWRLGAATFAASASGALVTASLMFSTTASPNEPWRTALLPTLAVSLLAFAATRIGRQQKLQLGTAEKRRGRSASQVAANLGVAALVSSVPVQIWLVDWSFVAARLAPVPVFTLGLASLAEAAADTVSSEIGQVFGGQPRLITSLGTVKPGRNGAVSLVGILSGMIAAASVAWVGTWSVRGDREVFAISCAGGVFGMFFDSLLGATLEDRGWLNNDAVNFLSTASAAAFALLLLALTPHPGVG